jgi:MFS family permease
MVYDAGEQKRKRSLRYSTGEGAFNAASNTIRDTFTVPYAMALKATNFEIGLLNSLKSFADIAAQIPGAKITDYMSRKNICYLSMLVSKLLWLPIIILPIFFGNAVLILLSLLTISVFFQSLRRPAWTSLMGDIVKQEERGRYFAWRNTVTNFTSLIATVAAGFILTALGFEALFVIAIMLGSAAFFIFTQMHEPFFKKNFFYKRTLSFSGKEIINFFKINKNFTSFTLYMTFLSFSTDISAAFIVVYILKDLAISYELFAIAVASGMLARIVSQRYWGYFNDRYGSRRVLGICAVLIAFVPFLYIFSSNVYHILLVRIYDGVVWAGMDLVAFNFLLGITPSEKRPTFVANHNVLVGAGSMIGALVGGIFVESLSGGGSTLFTIQMLFAISFVLRFVCLIALRFVRDTEYHSEKTKYIVLNPIATEMRKAVHHTKELGIHSTWRIMGTKESVQDALKESKYKSIHEAQSKKKKNLYKLPERNENNNK